jgi:imidazolonepropionase-like amidohydrolase
MTDEERSTLIEVAHRNGIKVTVRNGIKVTAGNGSSEAAHQALKFGVDGFEHGYHLDLGRRPRIPRGMTALIVASEIP